MRRGDQAADDARRVVARTTSDLRDARLAAGLSLAEAARVAGISAAQLGRLERGEIAMPTLEQIWRAWSPYGFRPSLRTFAIGSPVRDRAQLALFTRFQPCLGDPLRLRREIPLPIAGDARAWDAMIDGGSEPAFVEGESHMRDAQAFERRLRLKMRDDPRARIVLLVATRSDHNRRVLAEHREALRDLLPLDGAVILRHLRAGRVPPASGMVLI
jgi:transcriptional regulator with XRE-family HTH domain